MDSTTVVEVSQQASVATGNSETLEMLATSVDSTEVSERTYLGVLKSYNDRRGFGFVACAEIVAQFGRDVYLPKTEAAQALVMSPKATKMAEDDILQFRVRLSSEGYPQAAEAKRLRKFKGTVVSPPSVDAQGLAIPGLLSSAELAEAHGECAIAVLPETVGQLRLVQGDEVSFSVQDNCGGEPLEAQLVCLEQTERPVAAVLGLFACRLPRDKQRPDLVLHCHAFRDKIVAAELPADTTETELLHFFSKQGATGVSMTYSAGVGLAAAQFPGVAAVSRVLSSAVHAFADDTETKVGAIFVAAAVEQQPPLPALPRPSLTGGQEPGVLLVTWSPSVIASRYVLEMRVANAQSAWIVVDDSTGNLRRSECSSCRVKGLPTNVLFEVRVSYATDCGTRSEASDASESRVAMPLAKAEDRVPAPLPASAFPSQAAAVFAPAAAWTAPGGADASIRMPTQQFPTEVTLALAQAVQTGTVPRAMSQAVQPCAHNAGWQYANVAPWPLETGDLPASMPAQAQPSAPSACWQCAHGAVIPAPPVPKVHWADEAGGSVLVQWAPTAHAAAYAVELQEAGGSASERFVRAATLPAPGCLVDLQIGGLRQCAPGSCYTAKIRCIAPCGCESAPSAPGWSPPNATPLAQPAAQPQAAAPSPPPPACLPDGGPLPNLLRCAAQPFTLCFPALQPEVIKPAEPMPMLTVPFGMQDMQAGFGPGAMFNPSFQTGGRPCMQTGLPAAQPDCLMLD